jgi:hypothetical protein
VPVLVGAPEVPHDEIATTVHIAVAANSPGNLLTPILVVGT